MDVESARAQTLLHDLRFPVYIDFVLLRAGSFTRHPCAMPDYPGRGGRRVAAQRAGDSRRHFPARKTKYGIRCIWDGGGDGSGDWPDRGWLDYRQLQLAVA